MIDIDSKTWQEEVIKSNIPVVVDFWAEWCGPCKNMLVLLEEIEKKYDNIKIVKVDIEKDQILAAEHGLKSIPTVLVFNNGKISGKVVGVNSKTKQELYKIIDGIL